jgi:hypothetical protein
MSSEFQIEANRRNSQKSTGPHTAAGKAVSSLNRTRSGIFAESKIIRDENHSHWTLRRVRRAVSSDSGRIFGRLQHRIASTRRNDERALKELQRLQANRPIPDLLPSLWPVLSAETSSTPIGFVPSSSPVPRPCAKISPIPAQESLHPNLDPPSEMRYYSFK